MWIKQPADLSLAQMCERLAVQGVQIKVPALWHQLNQWGLSFKKERCTPASKNARTCNRQGVRGNSSSVPCRPAGWSFFDESCATTEMTRTRGRAPRGQRCVASAPQGHWKATSFIAGLRHNAVTAPMVVDGPMDVALFVAYVSQFLCPTLQAGDIVIADNLACHKVKAVRQAIEAVGASICYLPPYSPDLNPIEKLFAKLKALLRKAATRTVDALWQEIGQLLDALPATQCRNYFASSGFVIA